MPHQTRKPPVASDPPPAPVEEVRDALKRLGYLDSGVDRFVLAGVGGESLLRTCLKTALRVGLASGPLIGTALTVAALSLDSRLSREPGDALVLEAYAVVTLGLLAGVAAVSAGLLAAFVGRRVGPVAAAALSRGMGLAFGLGGVLYAALWWHSRGLGASFGLQSLALAVSLALGIALSRFGSLATIAVLSASSRGRLPEASLSRRHVLVSVLFAGLLAAFGVAISYSNERASVPAPDYAVVPTGLHVRVLGIDGMERRMTEQMLSRGEMPHLHALLGRAAHARLVSEPEPVPAIVWTTIATGRGSESHGVLSTSARRLAGMRTPVSDGSAGGHLLSALSDAADLLRLTRVQPPTALVTGVKTFWNVSSEKGLKVGVVNWWATWPAEPLNGFVVTDRSFFKLDRGGPPDREAFPPEALGALSALLGPKEAALPRRLDRFAASALLTLEGGSRPDVEAVYLPGLDIVTSQLLGNAASADVAGLEARLEGVRGYYRFVDGLIGELAFEAEPGETLLLIGDPGRTARQGGEPAEGTLVLSGPPFRPGDLGVAGERDIAPTVLHLVGLPTSQEMKGHVLESALDASFRSSHPVRLVATLGRRPRPRAEESAFDQQMVEELKSLGYVR